MPWERPAFAGRSLPEPERAPLRRDLRFDWPAVIETSLNAGQVNAHQHRPNTTTAALNPAVKPTTNPLLRLGYMVRLDTPTVQRLTSRVPKGQSEAGFPSLTAPRKPTLGKSGLRAAAPHIPLCRLPAERHRCAGFPSPPTIGSARFRSAACSVAILVIAKPINTSGGQSLRHIPLSLISIRMSNADEPSST